MIVLRSQTPNDTQGLITCSISIPPARKFGSGYARLAKWREQVGVATYYRTKRIIKHYRLYYDYNMQR